MAIRRVLLIAAAIAFAAAGFLIAQHVERALAAERATTAQQAFHAHEEALRAAAQKWADEVSMTEGKAVLQAFVAGIAPAVLAQRRDSVELSAASLLRVPGVAGIHVFGPEAEVAYSSDAKLTTPGITDARVEWALQATQLTSRPSARAGVVDLAMPIESSGTRLAVVWLEYDLAGVRDAARPAFPGPATGNSGAGS